MRWIGRVVAGVSLLFVASAGAACAKHHSAPSSANHTARLADLPDSLNGLRATLAALGYARVSGNSGNARALFQGVTGGPLLQAEYVNPTTGDIVTIDFSSSKSDTALQQARDANIQDAIARGLADPVVDGNRFFMSVPARQIGAQKDLIGWILPANGIVLIQRSSKTSPVPPSTALALLNSLAGG